MAIRRSPAPRRPARRISAREYFAMPETMQRMDLIDGELIVAPSPLWFHQQVVLEIAFALKAFAAGDGGLVILSPMDVEFSDDVVLQPDAGYIRKENAGRVQQHVVGPPDLVVEVLSPGTRRSVHERKMAKYAAFGVPEAWVVDPAKRLTAVCRNEAGGWNPAGEAPFGEPIPSGVVSVGDGGLGQLAAGEPGR